MSSNKSYIISKVEYHRTTASQILELTKGPHNTWLPTRLPKKSILQLKRTYSMFYIGALAADLILVHWNIFVKYASFATNT